MKKGLFTKSSPEIQAQNESPEIQKKNWGTLGHTPKNKKFRLQTFTFQGL